MQMEIDGRAVTIKVGDCRAGWCDVFEIGETLSDRVAYVARYAVPETLLKHGGAIRTGGHVYRVAQ